MNQPTIYQLLVSGSRNISSHFIGVNYRLFLWVSGSTPLSESDDANTNVPPAPVIWWLVFNLILTLDPDSFTDQLDQLVIDKFGHFNSSDLCASGSLYLI
jgi:hypothetical protein